MILKKMEEIIILAGKTGLTCKPQEDHTKNLLHFDFPSNINENEAVLDT